MKDTKGTLDGLRIISTATTIVSLCITLLSAIVDAKKTDLIIEEKVNEAVKALQE